MKPEDIRVSSDLCVLNKSMQRTRLSRDCQLFSKLDMNHGYHQFALDAALRKLMTFPSPEGNYR